MPTKKKYEDEVLDLRGLTCPKPVLTTKKLFDNTAVFSAQVLVDDQINVYNLERLARSCKLSIQSKRNADGFLVSLTRIDAKNQNNSSLKKTQRRSSSLAKRGKVQINRTASKRNSQSSTTVVFINQDSFGQGDPTFSQHLLNLFLQTIYDSGQIPQAILLANSGVKLMDKNSPFQKVFCDFRNLGCEVLACGLCVEFYQLKDVVSEDHITNMFAICEYLFAADKVIQP